MLREGSYKKCVNLHIWMYLIAVFAKEGLNVFSYASG